MRTLLILAFLLIAGLAFAQAVVIPVGNAPAYVPTAPSPVLVGGAGGGGGGDPGGTCVWETSTWEGGCQWAP